MKQAGYAFALVAALVALSTLGQEELRPAELGAGLAQLLSTYAPVELYHQRIALAQLAGGTEPDPGTALEALKKAEELGMSVLQSALEKGLSALEKDELEELLGTLGQVRSAVDDVVMAASRDADAQGQGWPFQVAFLAQTVLLSPSPLYLNIEEEWAAYLAGGLPPGIPTEGASALDTLLELANHAREGPKPLPCGTEAPRAGKGARKVGPVPTCPADSNGSLTDRGN